MKNSPDARRRKSVLQFWIAAILAIPVVYVLSSGPVIAAAFWARETTGYDAFYAILWLYFPILILGHGNPVDAYIEWWVVDVFHTVGPG